MKRQFKINSDYEVVIKDHVLKRYLQRTNKMDPQLFDKLVCSNDKHEKKVIERHRKELEEKFRMTKLGKFMETGAEFRREVKGEMIHRLNFVAYKKGKTFEVVTCYVQGKRDAPWKTEEGQLKY